MSDSLANPWTAAYQAPPSTGFSRQEYLSGVPLPSLHYWPHYYTANRREKVEAMTDILFLVSKITEDGNFRKLMTNLDSVLKSRHHYSAKKRSI